MNCDNEPVPSTKPLAQGWHHTFGWLRRRDLDKQHAGYVYEMPDGMLAVSKERRHRHGMYLGSWKDEQTGEIYIACSHAPRVYNYTRRRDA